MGTLKIKITDNKGTVVEEKKIDTSKKKRGSRESKDTKEG